MMQNRTASVLLLVVVVIYIAVCFVGLHELNIYVPDSGRYMIWANALARGEGYRDASSPTPTRYVIHSPLYAVLLVPSQWLFPNSIEAAKATTVLFGAASILALFFFFRIFFGNTIALIASLLFTLHPETINYSTQVLTESPFVFISLLLFIVLYRIIIAEKKSVTLTISLIVLIGITVLLREVGVVLAFSAGLFLFVMKRKNDALNVFLTMAIVYGAWFVRNEIIIAGKENPSTRNSKIFTTHMYTEPSAPMTKEYYERVKTNARIYGKYGLHALFSLGFRYPLAKEIYYREAPVSWVLQSKLVFDGVAVIITLGILFVGVYRSIVRKVPLNFLFLAYTVFNGTVLFLYPVTDVRFLYPLLPILFFYFFYGVAEASSFLMQSWRHARYAILGVVFLLSFPNAVWSCTYQWQNYRYAVHPEECYSLLEKGQEYFSSALKPAALWVCDHTSPHEVVLGKWNEISLYLGGRKVVLTNPQALSGEFEELIRDYSIRYIICSLRPDSSNEYQMLFSRSKRYSFLPVYRKGSTEIREIVRKGKERTIPEMFSVSQYEKDYTEAYTTIETDPHRSYERFVAMGIKYRNIDCIFNIGVTFAFMDSLDRAERYFKKFLILQQAGAYLRLTSYHLLHVANMREVDSLQEPHERSYAFHNAGLLLWHLGYPYRALLLMDSALSMQSFFPASITGAVFAFHYGDTLKSLKYLRDARRIEPNHILTRWLSQIHQYCDSLRQTVSFEKKLSYRCSIARAYREMGFINAAIDELADVLEEAPRYQEANDLLAQYFKEKKRYFSALRMYERLQAIQPENTNYRAEYDELKRKLDE